MKASCSREGLSSAFQVAAGVVPTRSPKPILKCVRLEFGADAGELTATDLELGVRYQLSGVNVDDPGVVVIPFSSMSAILRETRDTTLVIESTPSGTRVRGEFARFDLPSEDPVQFPSLPKPQAVVVPKIKTSVLSEMIRRTVFCVAPENSRYALHSVLVEFADGQARMVGTDGKRLGLMVGTYQLETQPPTGHWLIAPRALQLLQKVLVEPDEEVEIALGENEALFRTKRVEIHSRLVEGRFPRYVDVFPGDAKIKVPVGVEKLLSVVNQAKIVTNNQSRGVQFRFESGMLTLESQSPDLGQSEVKLPLGFDGPSLELIFDPQLLADALKVLPSEDEVTLDLVDEKRAAVLRSPDQYAYVMMPLTKDSQTP